MTELGEYWKGRMDEKVAEHDRRLEAINGNIADTAAALSSVQVELAGIKTKVAAWSALGGLAGSGFVAVAVGLILH